MQNDVVRNSVFSTLKTKLVYRRKVSEMYTINSVGGPVR